MATKFSVAMELQTSQIILIGILEHSVSIVAFNLFILAGFML